MKTKKKAVKSVKKSTKVATKATKKVVAKTAKVTKKAMKVADKKEVKILPIIERVKSFEDACKVLKINSKKLPLVDALPEEHQKSIVAYYKLIIIAKALNEGWTPNWDNYNEYKYFAWFEINSSGFGFSNSTYVDWGADTDVGSRLCFKSIELVLHAINSEKIASLYKEWVL